MPSVSSRIFKPCELTCSMTSVPPPVQVLQTARDLPDDVIQRLEAQPQTDRDLRTEITWTSIATLGVYTVIYLMFLGVIVGLGYYFSVFFNLSDNNGLNPAAFFFHAVSAVAFYIGIIIHMFPSFTVTNRTFHVFVGCIQAVMVMTSAIALLLNHLSSLLPALVSLPTLLYWIYFLLESVQASGKRNLFKHKQHSLRCFWSGLSFVILRPIDLMLHVSPNDSSFVTLAYLSIFLWSMIGCEIYLHSIARPYTDRIQYHADLQQPHFASLSSCVFLNPHTMLVKLSIDSSFQLSPGLCVMLSSDGYSGSWHVISNEQEAMRGDILILSQSQHLFNQLARVTVRFQENRIPYFRNRQKELLLVCYGTGFGVFVNLIRQILNDHKDTTRISLIHIGSDVLMRDVLDQLALNSRFSWGHVQEVNEYHLRVFESPLTRLVVSGPPQFIAFMTDLCRMITFAKRDFLTLFP
ncbi:hypothetical protein EDD86DRAFT_198944 [Gorgonomyces haynaldii]|nr:hypothetical protein EDD86DRAFT_198944 [Gorgonomyces haynaldii]